MARKTIKRTTKKRVTRKAPVRRKATTKKVVKRPVRKTAKKVTNKRVAKVKAKTRPVTRKKLVGKQKIVKVFTYQTKVKNYNKKADGKVRALPPGQRLSKRGKPYTETRANRSDKKGTMF